MRSAPYRLLILVLVSGIWSPVSGLWSPASVLHAQIPQVVSVQLYLEEGGLPVNGMRTLDVRWYDAVAGGVAVHTETLTADVVDGIATVLLGSVVPFPTDLLLQGPFWLGISINGGPELSPRTMLASVPYAMLTERARIAQELAPEVTGVVTSINEAAGAIHLDEGPGVRIDRQGSVFTLSSKSVVETGIITGRPGAFDFVVQPLTTLTGQHAIHVRVEGETVIGVQVAAVDLATNTIRFITAAPLLADESIVWSVLQ